MTIEAANFRYGATYMNIARSDDLVFIQITANNTRGLDQKKRCSGGSRHCGREPRPSGEDVFVNIVEVAKENWSFGHGLAQYAESPRPHARGPPPARWADEARAGRAAMGLWEAVLKMYY